MPTAKNNKQALTVSLIIPAYNEARHILACLDAVAAQTIMPYEVIVVDNNSSDTTVKLAKKYRFVAVVSEKRQGVLWARNTGFNAAQGDIIGRIDADTILPPNWIEEVQRFYANPACSDRVLTGGAYFYNVRFPHFAGWIQGQIAFRMNRVLLGHYITYGSNLALPAALWQAVRGLTCKDPSIHEDLDLGIHLYRAGYGITYNEGFRVGVKMRRVRSDQATLWENMMWWPRTLRRHGIKTWIFGWLGAVIFYVLSPVISLVESTARLLGAKPIDE